MSNVNGTISNTKFISANGDLVSAVLRDNASSHYLGKLNSDEQPSSAAITLDGGTTVTAVTNDWVTLKSKPDAFIYTGSTWEQFGAGTLSQERVNAINGINTAAPSSPLEGSPIQYYSYDATNGVLTLFQMASTKTKILSDIYNPQSWNTKTWTGLTNFSGDNIWTDGDNVYYSDYDNNYVLDKATSTWSTKTWTGLTEFSGANVWTDGDNIYYSYGSSSYVLDKSTSTWSSISFSGLSKFWGSYIWTDGENVYYSYDGHYVLNKATLTWTEKTWYGGVSPYSTYIWTDGANTYYSYEGNNYVLDKSTSTWNSKTWYGLTNFSGQHIWTDGDNMYYSVDESIQYVLNKATSTWSSKTWSGYTDIRGFLIWTDGENVYYSNGSTQKVLE